MKDFATKKTRVDEMMESSPVSPGSRPVGRWILLTVVVLIMVGYAIWSHRQEFAGWLSAKAHGKSVSAALPVPPSTPKTAVPLASSAPAVQFDFYHVLTNDSGKGAALPKEELVQTSKVPVAQEEKKSVMPEAAVPQTPAAPVSSPSPTPMSPIMETPAAPKPMVVKPSNAAPKAAMKTPVKVSPPKPAKIEGYVVEAANFTDKNKAQALRGKLLMLGFEPQIAVQNGHYHVHFGLMKNEKDADALKHQLAKSGINASILSVN